MVGCQNALTVFLNETLFGCLSQAEGLLRYHLSNDKFDMGTTSHPLPPGANFVIRISKYHGKYAQYIHLRIRRLLESLESQNTNPLPQNDPPIH